MVRYLFVPFFEVRKPLQSFSGEGILWLFLLSSYFQYFERLLRVLQFSEQRKFLRGIVRKNSNFKLNILNLLNRLSTNDYKSSSTCQWGIVGETFQL
jgi:hypothetical protein